MAFPARILPLAIALGLAATATGALFHQSGQDADQIVAAVGTPHTVGEPAGRHPLPRPSPSRPYGVS